MMYRRLLGLGPLPIRIGRTRLIFAIRLGLLAAAIALFPTASTPTQMFEGTVAGLIATLLYEPMQRLTISPRVAPRVGAAAAIAGILQFLLYAELQHAVTNSGLHFVLVVAEAMLFVGCMFVADRMRAIWRESL